MPKFNPPESFDFSKPQDWPLWKQRFIRFRIATKLNQEEPVVQVSSLIYAMGREAENVFQSFNLSNEPPEVGEGEDAEPADVDNIDVVLERFD